MSVNNYPEKVFIERRSESAYPDEDAYWDEAPQNKTDVPYVRHDIVQNLRKTIADLYLERDIAMSKVASLKTELTMAMKALKPFTKASGADFMAARRARKVRKTYNLLGAK